MLGRLAAVVTLVGCTTPERSPAPSVPAVAPSAPRQRSVAVTGVGTYTTTLVYLQPGRLLVGNEGNIALVDTIRGLAIGSHHLGSAVVDDPVDPIHHTISRDVLGSVWGSDRDRLLGVVMVGGFGGDAPRGLGVWSPATEPAPVAIDVRGNAYCRPIALSPDRATVATAGCDPSGPGLGLLSTATRASIAHQDLGVLRAVFSPDSKQLAFSTLANDLGTYDIASATTTMLPKLHREMVLSLAYHPTRSLLATADADFVVYAWDLARGTHERILEKASHLAFSPDGRYLAAAARDHLVLLDTKTWRRVGSQLPIKFSWGPDALAWSPDSSQLAASINSDVVALVDIRAPPPSSIIDDAWWNEIHPLPAPKAATPPAIVRDGVIEGRVTMGGKSVANAEIKLLPHAQEWPDARALVGPTASTDREGRFHLDHVPRIEWNAIATAPGATLAGFVASLRENPTVTVELGVEPAVTVTGSVLGPDRKPASGVRITHYRYDSVLDLDITTSADGHFTIDHIRPEKLPAGATDPRNYTLVFRRADGAVRVVRLGISKPGRIDTPVTLLAPTDPRVLRAHVIDGADTPISAAVVTFDGRSVPSDANGDASLDVDTKSVSVSVWNGRLGSTAQVVTMPHREPLTIRLADPL